MLITNTRLIDLINNRRSDWAKALTSELYEQGKTYLKQVREDSPPKYCCLGVACEVFGKETGVEEHPYHRFWTGAYAPVSFAESGASLGKETYLPDSMRKYLGLSKKSEYILSELNDSGVSFTVIAKILRLLPTEVDDK